MRQTTMQLPAAPTAQVQPGDEVTLLPPYHGVDRWTGKSARVVAVEPLFPLGEGPPSILTARLEIEGVDDGYFFRLSRLAPRCA